MCTLQPPSNVLEDKAIIAAQQVPPERPKCPLPTIKDITLPSYCSFQDITTTWYCLRFGVGSHTILITPRDLPVNNCSLYGKNRSQGPQPPVWQAGRQLAIDWRGVCGREWGIERVVRPAGWLAGQCCLLSRTRCPPLSVTHSHRLAHHTQLSKQLVEFGLMSSSPNRQAGTAPQFMMLNTE